MSGGQNKYELLNMDTHSSTDQHRPACSPAVSAHSLLTSQWMTMMMMMCSPLTNTWSQSHVLFCFSTSLWLDSAATAPQSVLISSHRKPSEPRLKPKISRSVWASEFRLAQQTLLLPQEHQSRTSTGRKLLPGDIQHQEVEHDQVVVV